MKLSVISSVLNSQEVLRRQLLYWRAMNLDDDIEFIIMDDGSEPPLVDPVGLRNLRIVQTHDTRPWTWAIARNAAAKISEAPRYLMADIDFIIPKEAIEYSRDSAADRVQFIREFGILTENGVLTQNLDILVYKYGLSLPRVRVRGLKIPPHNNTFAISAEKFWALGGYLENRIGRPYPQGEDTEFRKRVGRAVVAGAVTLDTHRPKIYMFPNGKFCGDLDYNPMGLFHTLSRKV